MRAVGYKGMWACGYEGMRARGYERDYARGHLPARVLPGCFAVRAGPHAPALVPKGRDLDLRFF